MDIDIVARDRYRRDRDAIVQKHQHTRVTRRKYWQPGASEKAISVVYVADCIWFSLADPSQFPGVQVTETDVWIGLDWDETDLLERWQLVDEFCSVSERLALYEQSFRKHAAGRSGQSGSLGPEPGV
jgi:hypothetical protein